VNKMYCLDDEKYKYLKNMVKKVMDPDTGPENALDYTREIGKIVLSMEKKPKKSRKREE